MGKSAKCSMYLLCLSYLLLLRPVCVCLLSSFRSIRERFERRNWSQSKWPWDEIAKMSDQIGKHRVLELSTCMGYCVDWLYTWLMFLMCPFKSPIVRWISKGSLVKWRWRTRRTEVKFMETSGCLKSKRSLCGSETDHLLLMSSNYVRH